MDVTCGGYTTAPAWEIFKPVIEATFKGVSRDLWISKQRKKHHRTEGITSLLLSQKARAGYCGGHTHRYTGINLTHNTATANLLSLKESYF